MSVTAFQRERASGSSPRSLLTLAGASADTITIPSGCTGIVVIMESLSGQDDFNGVKIGGTVGAVDGSGYTSGTLTLTDTGVAGSTLRVFKYFGSGIPTGAQPVHYSKTTTNNFAFATILCFVGETDIGTPVISTGSVGGTLNVSLTGTTAGREVYAAGYIDAGSGNTCTPAGGTTEHLDSNGSYGRGIVISKTSTGGTTTVSTSTAASTFYVAAFETISGPTGFSITAESGSYSTTGQSSSALIVSPATQGTYTLTGVSVALNHVQPGAFNIIAESGAYSLIGVDGSNDFGFGVDSGTYSLSGQDTTFIITTPQQFSLVAEAGLYAVVGRSTRLVWSGDPILIGKKGQTNSVGVKIGL